MAKDITAIVTLAGAISPTLQKTLDKSKSMLASVGKKAAVAGAAIGTAVVAGATVAGKALYDIGSEFDNMLDTIRVGTGATGTALEALQNDAKMVLASLPTTTENASKAIADFNTRLGLTGEQLQAVSKRGIQVADMLGEDLGTVIEKSSQALQGWSVPADQMAGKMDYLFKVSQSTGIGYSELNDILIKNGATMRAFGYSFDTAAALIGGMTKAGVPAQETIQAMQRGLATLADKGLNAADGFALYSKRIKDAKTQTEAINIASELFGTRGGAKMAIAIREGKFDIAALTKELQSSSETINSAASDTYDFAEQWTILKNRMKVALAPVGESVFNQLGAMLPELGDTINKLMPTIKKLAEQLGKVLTKAFQAAFKALKSIIPALESAFDGMSNFIGFLKKNGDLTISILSGIGTVIAITLVPAVWSAVSACWAFTAALLANPITWIIIAIGALVAAIVYLWQNWDQVAAWFSESWEWLKGKFSEWGASISGTFEFIGNVISSTWEKIKIRFGEILDYISTVFAEGWKTAWNAIVDSFGTIFGNIGEFMKKPLNWCIEKLNSFIGALNMIKIPDWVPEVGGKGINIPLIPMLAKGGFTDGISIAGEAGTEAVVSFDPSVRSRNIAIWARAGEMLGVDSSLDPLTEIRSSIYGGGNSVSLGGITINIDAGTNASPQSIAEAIRAEIEDVADMLQGVFTGRKAGTYGNY